MDSLNNSKKVLPQNFHLQFISHHFEGNSYLDSIRMALEGGCRWVQLRMKETPDEVLLENAIKAKELCRQFGATFIIDDNVEIVQKVEADGVHLGKNDMPVDQCRAILGERYIIGGTANTFDDVKKLATAGADYIGCGPFWFTTTKKNLSPILGLDGYREIVRRMKEEEINLPIVAIGGITYDDITPILETGVSGIAISGSILRAENPVDEMRKYVDTIFK